jgi:hypothetical protein
MFISKKVARDVKYVQEFDFKEAVLLEKCCTTVLDLVFHENRRDRFSCRSTESYSIQNFYMVHQIKKGVVWFQKLKKMCLYNFKILLLFTWNFGQLGQTNKTLVNQLDQIVP